MPSIVSLQAPRSVAVVDEPDTPVRPGQVRVETLHSAISAGTELASYRGSSPHLRRRWDPESRLFVDGADAIRYPVTDLGYGEVGRVVELGPVLPRDAPDSGTADRGDAAVPAVGDLVWGTWGHRTGAVVDATVAAGRVIRTDEPRAGVFAHIGAVALGAVLDADIHVGETVVVFGLGVPGQLASQFARLNGARVIAVDGIAARRELATRLGADLVLDPSDDVAGTVRGLTGGRGADAVIELTGNHHALQEAIRTVAYGSRVCVAGFFQGDASGLRLGEEFHHNRVQLVSSQISGVPTALQHRWSRTRLWATAVDAAISGRIEVLPLISHDLPFRDAATAFEMLDERPSEALQVVLDFGTTP